jgi:hypothetical protein
LQLQLQVLQVQGVQQQKSLRRNIHIIVAALHKDSNDNDDDVFEEAGNRSRWQSGKSSDEDIVLLPCKMYILIHDIKEPQ